MSGRNRILFVGVILYIIRYGLFSLSYEAIEDYIWCLADGHGNDTEKRIWAMLINTTDGETIYALKHGKRQTSWELYIICLYAILVLISPIWLNPILSLAYTKCNPLNHHSDLSSCVIMPNQIWREIDYHIDYRGLYVHKKMKDISSQRYRDVDSGTHFRVYHMIDNTFRWIRHVDMIRQLHDYKNNTCVCPVFMGLRENMTFLVLGEDKQLVIMYKPFVYRNNTLSNRIQSSLLYHKHSPFYDNYESFMSNTVPRMSSEQIHYETLYVEYTEIIDDYKDCDITPGSDQIMFDIEREPQSSEQKRITLTKKDAICFYFCDTANRIALN